MAMRPPVAREDGPWDATPRSQAKTPANWCAPTWHSCWPAAGIRAWSSSPTSTSSRRCTSAASSAL